MKRENGIGMIGIVILVAFIVGVATGIYKVAVMKQNSLKESSVKSEMLLIQGACKVLKGESDMHKKPEELVGTKVTEMDKNNDIDQSVVGDFKTKNVVEPKDWEKYYVLTNPDLEKLKVDVKNREGAYFLVNYESGEVIYTAGCNGKYKLSNMQ